MGKATLVAILFLLMSTTSWAQQDTIAPPVKSQTFSYADPLDELELVRLLSIIQYTEEVNDEFMSVWLSIRINRSGIMPYDVYLTEQDYNDIINGKMVLFREVTMQMIKDCRTILGYDD